MAEPANVQVSFDKDTYNPGDTVTGKVTWDSGEELQTLTVTVSVSVTNQSGEVGRVSSAFKVNQETGTDTFTVETTDDGNRTWSAEVDPSGTAATITTTA